MHPNRTTCTIVLCAVVGFAMLLTVSLIGFTGQLGSSTHTVSLGAPEADEEALDVLSGEPTRLSGFDAAILRHAERLLRWGRQIFRFDTFGSQTF